MSKNMNLRKKSRINYYEPREPDFDEYVFCDLCNDYVYKYCSLHGPLLVIPDDEIPVETNLPDFVPRAALTIPKEFLHLAPSTIPSAGIGVFSTVTLPRGVRFGPYRGQCTFEVTSSYCWQIYNARHKPSHIVDALDGAKSNWMRFVNCSRHCSEQNLVAFQYKGELYYRTIRTIPRFTELLVFYGSQYAHFLKINLALYNSQSFVCLVKFDRPLPKLHKINNSIETLDLTTSKNYPLPKLHKIPKEYELHEDLDGNNFADNFGDSRIENIAEGRQFYIEDDTSTQRSISYHTEVSPSNTAIDLNNNISNTNNSDLREIFLCNTCNKSFRTKGDLIEHIKTHIVLSNSNLLSCKFCEYRTMYTAKFEIHLNLHDQNRKTQCSFCGYRFNKLSSLQRHVEAHFNHHEPKKYQCPCHLCPYIGTDTRNLNQHIAKNHKSELKCQICNFSTTSEYLFNRHKGTHALHQCEICSRVVCSSTSLRRHMRLVHKQIMF